MARSCWSARIPKRPKTGPKGSISSRLREVKMGRKGSAQVAVEGIKCYRVKGKFYCYDRATGTRLNADFGTQNFLPN